MVVVHVAPGMTVVQCAIPFRDHTLNILQQAGMYGVCRQHSQAMIDVVPQVEG